MVTISLNGMLYEDAKVFINWLRNQGMVDFNRTYLSYSAYSLSDNVTESENCLNVELDILEGQ